MITSAEESTLTRDLDDDDHDDHDEFDRLKLIDPREFDFMKLSRRVCLISRDDATEASGILVGPDLMLTAAHALLGTSGIFADPAHVRIKFDQFLWNARTGRRAKGDECGLRPIPFTNQPDVLASSIKVDHKSRRRYPSETEGLDYVLVRLDRPIGLAFLPYSHRIRGWNNCSRAEIPPRGRVYVVQHPLGGLQKVADGVIYDQLPDPNFPYLFKYRTVTQNGSSGAPISDLQKRVVGMHIGEVSEAEQLGVSFQAIFKDLELKGVKLPPFRLKKDVMDSIFGTSTIERERHSGDDWRGDRLFDDVDHDKDD